MARKKRAKKKVVKKTKKVSTKKKIKKDSEPDYMVQVSDPKMVRKDILESLREVIIFMQGYEKFCKIQEEKVLLFTSLRTQIKSLKSLINDNLRKCLPQGKLRTIEPVSQVEVNPQTIGNQEVQAPAQKVPTSAERDLTELESQLKDIENQLQRI